MISDIKHKILVVGSVGYDTIATPSGRVENVIGGSANYFSIVASQYSQVNVVGVIGKDYRAEDLGVCQGALMQGSPGRFCCPHCSACSAPRCSRWWPAS